MTEDGAMPDDAFREYADLRESLARGIKQAEAGELLDLGSFAQYLELDEDDD